MEKTIETKQCKHCNTPFEITDKDLEFYEKLSPVFCGKKYLIPSPTLCPDCRQQRRLSFRNQKNLYRRKCDFSGKDILSIYSPDKPYKVYENCICVSDKWNVMDYSQEYNEKESFFEQFKQLKVTVPRQSLSNINCENCDYSNGLVNSKDSYLSFGNDSIENVMYAYESGKSSFSMDLLWSYTVDNSYEILDSVNMNNCMFCISSSFCYRCYFCRDCNNCSNCLFCFGLANKENCILNIEYTKKEFEKKLKDFLNMPDFVTYGKKTSTEFFKKLVHKYNNSINNDNSFGDYIYDCKNVYNGFSVVGISDSRYVYDSGRTSDILDGSYIYDSVGKMYDSINIYNSYDIIFSIDINSCSNILYSDNLLNCNNCFGCVGLSNKSYCVLNKQYIKEEYEKLVENILEKMITPPAHTSFSSRNKPHPNPLLQEREQATIEWGEFFPSILSPFGYNETDAQGYFSLKIEDTVEKGFNWSTYKSPFPKVEKIIPANKLPYDIKKIPDDILNWAIKCEITNKPFRIIKQELEFYRKYNLPIPKRHPDQRHLDRMNIRNSRKLYDRKCDKCGENIKTTYSLDREEIIYCEECYGKEIY